jgi:multidrug efflux system outer membrane protein
LSSYNRVLYIAIAVSLILAGCANYNKVEAPEPAAPAAWQYQSDQAAQALPGQWWAEFEDETLNSLIERALAQAPDRRLALSRITEARALTRNTSAQMMPLVTGGLDAQRGDAFRANGNNGGFVANFDASWELDLFGKNLQRIYAAQASRDALIADEKAATLSLIAEITRQYTLYRLYQQQVLLAESAATAQQGILKVSEARYKQGIEGNLELQRARSLQQTTEGQIPFFRDQAQISAYQIDYLVGDVPGKNAELLKPTRDVPLLNREALLDVPATIIQSRPDIKAAEERVVAATSLKRSTIAEIYPTISLSGLVRFTAGNTGDLFNADNRTWTAGAGLLAPLFQFGRLRSAIDASKAREEQAIIQYEQIVLNALREIETSAQSYQKSKERYTTLASALDAAEKAVVIARKQYKEGILSQLDVLQAEQNAFTSENSAIQAASNMTVNFIALCKALALRP